MTTALNTAAHPGEIIRDELEARGWSQRDLAYVLGVPEGSITLLLSGKRGVSADMARMLGDAFAVSADFFLRLQAAYELALARTPDRSVALKGKLQSAYPIREMIRRGWFDDATPELLERDVSKFFEWSLAFAAKTSSYERATPAQLAWVSRVRQIARETVLPAYSASKLRAAIPNIRALMSAPDEVRHVPRVLSELGVRFVVVEVLQGSKMDGVCLWLDEKSPVIGMSLRFDRIDNFWFVLAHELTHVLEGHGRTAPMIDDDLEASGHDLPPEEQLANDGAQNFCVPTKEFELFVARKAPYFSETDLIGFSARQGLHPGIVAGRLRRRLNNWKLFSKHLVKVRAQLSSSAVVDGWGDIAPTETP